MNTLSLPSCHLILKERQGKTYVLDLIRHRYVAYTPEEHVRQYIMHFLVEHRQYPASLMAVEMPFKVARMRKRSDVVVYNNRMEPLMLIECKAPSVTLTDKVFDQAAVYNLHLKAPYILITNGVQHYCMELDAQLHKYQFLIDIPEYHDLDMSSDGSPAEPDLFSMR